MLRVHNVLYALPVPGLVVHERRIEPPGEALGQGGGRDFGGPIVVGGVAVARQALLMEGLHQPVELGSEAAFAEVRAGIDEVAFTLPPLCPSVLEPDLR